MKRLITTLLIVSSMLFVPALTAKADHSKTTYRAGNTKSSSKTQVATKTQNVKVDARGAKTSYQARVTFYCNALCPWGDQIASSNGRAKEGITVAAHPNFRFGTNIAIPGIVGLNNYSNKFVIQDRGSAVTSRKAAGGKAFVFDVFFYEDRRKYRTKRAWRLAAQNRLNYLMKVNSDYRTVYVM